LSCWGYENRAIVGKIWKEKFGSSVEVSVMKEGWIGEGGTIGSREEQEDS